jgi:hypothetical protein
MPKNTVARKSSRIVGVAVILGTGVAALLLGDPASAASVVDAGRGVCHTLGRGV